MPITTPQGILKTIQDTFDWAGEQYDKLPSDWRSNIKDMMDAPTPIMPVAKGAPALAMVLSPKTISKFEKLFKARKSALGNDKIAEALAFLETRYPTMAKRYPVVRDPDIEDAGLTLGENIYINPTTSKSPLEVLSHEMRHAIDDVRYPEQAADSIAANNSYIRSRKYPKGSDRYLQGITSYFSDPGERYARKASETARDAYNYYKYLVEKYLP